MTPKVKAYDIDSKLLPQDFSYEDFVVGAQLYVDGIEVNSNDTVAVRLGWASARIHDLETQVEALSLAVRENS